MIGRREGRRVSSTKSVERQKADCQILIVKYWLLNIDCQILIVKYWLSNIDCKILIGKREGGRVFSTKSVERQKANCQILIVKYWLSNIDLKYWFRILIVKYWLEGGRVSWRKSVERQKAAVLTKVSWLGGSAKRMWRICGQSRFTTFKSSNYENGLDLWSILF